MGHVRVKKELGSGKGMERGEWSFWEKLAMCPTCGRTPVVGGGSTKRP